jgi:hypothetical protein
MSMRPSFDGYVDLSLAKDNLASQGRLIEESFGDPNAFKRRHILR